MGDHLVSGGSMVSDCDTRSIVVVGLGFDDGLLDACVHRHRDWRGNNNALDARLSTGHEVACDS